MYLSNLSFYQGSLAPPGDPANRLSKDILADRIGIRHARLARNYLKSGSSFACKGAWPRRPGPGSARRGASPVRARRRQGGRALSASVAACALRRFRPPGSPRIARDVLRGGGPGGWRGALEHEIECAFVHFGSTKVVPASTRRKIIEMHGRGKAHTPHLVMPFR